MEKPTRPCDVCIICVLPEEARAFREVVEQQCNVTFTKPFDPEYKYDYHSATITNDTGELLVLHVLWLPLPGPVEVAFHLQSILAAWQPRICVMTGICAGDARYVQLGDLIVAERTFTYDNGKFILDDDGRKVYQPDTATYQLNANILHFLGDFDAWKPLVAQLRRPSSPHQQSRKRKITCHIKPMASGSAVRADHPFEEVRAPVRGTVAIDMESAAFGLVMSRHPLIPWLVVKGVCDYADENKNDTYHNYAACASALYALSFIQAYVTKQRLPENHGRGSQGSKNPRDGKDTANFSARPGTLSNPSSLIQEDEANFLALSAGTISNRKADPLALQKVFISYSHTDAKWLNRLQVHLTPLEREGIVVWDDTKIVPGDQWKEALSEALEMARIAITLVSADFLASNFITQYELPKLLSHAEKGGTVILPVIISPCLFSESDLKVFQAVNPPDKPLSAMKRSDREQVWVKVAEVIRKRLTIGETGGHLGASSIPSS